MMANFGNNNLLVNQKKRNFVYNPAVSRPGDRNFAQESGAQVHVIRARVPNSKRESPYKRFKSSIGLPTKRAEEIAAEKECRDLPSDAFDEEIDDDFDDELLTVEQLDECDRIVSKQLQTQWREPPVDCTVNLPQKNEYHDVSRNFVPPSNLDLGEGSFDEDELLASHCTQEYTSPSSYKVRTNFTGASGFHENVSRISRVPVVTHPEESVNLVQTVIKDDSLLESFVNRTGGSSNFMPKSNMDFKPGEGSATLASDYDNKLHDHSKGGQMQSLKKEIENLKTEAMSASAKVKRLEEEKFCKDGEIRILKDSLSYFKNEEKKRQAEVKAVAERQQRELSQHEKELEKQVENLTTQIQFKDREISQLIERNKKRSSLSTEVSSTPQKKAVNLSDVFPTGSSFFQKMSPEGKLKSPRGTKLNVKDLKTPGKNNSQRLSEGDNSENSVQSGTSSCASVLERARVHRREAEASEREIVQLFFQSFQDIELVQNLLSPQDKELCIPFQEPENRMLNDCGMISLLTLEPSSTNSSIITQRATLNETDMSHTLHLFDTPATSKFQKPMAVLTQKGSLYNNQDNSLVLQTLSVLLNNCQTCRDSKNMNFPSLSKNHMSTATNFLPLIERHVAHYVERRTHRNDDNFLGTCLPRSSLTPESPEARDYPGFESEHAVNLAVLRETALIALRLLNILVLYSGDVCECILKSARVFNETENEHKNDKGVERKDERQKIFSSKEEEGSFSQHPLFTSLKIAVKNDPNRQIMEVIPEKDLDTSGGENVVEHTEVLGYLFKLLVPQPKESMVVTYATLQVLTSLARNCEVKYCTRMLPLLSETLLTQCLSRDWSLTLLSQVTALLTPLTKHHGIVKRICSQSDECILVKIYQGWLFRPEDVSVTDYQQVHLQIVSFVNNLLSNGDASNFLFPLESECHCSIELIKCLVLMLDKVVSSVVQVSSDSLVKDLQNSQSLMLLRQGVFLLVTLSLNDRLFVEHRIEVEHQYVNLICSVTRLYQQITGLISEAEILAVQDLVDFERIDGIDWSQESEDEIDETTEGMDVDE